MAASTSLACLSVPVVVTSAAAAGPTFTAKALSATVSTSTVSAAATVAASTATTVARYKVCVRSSSGAEMDVNPAWTNVQITTSGTRWTGTKTFPRGSYSYFACVQRADGRWWDGPIRQFTVSAAGQPAGRVTKLLTVIEENHSLAQMKSGMHYLYGLARQYAYATDYTAASHPSLPNYLAIAGGDTFGVTDDANPSAHVLHGASIFGQALAAGKTARTYAESMPTNCSTTGNVDKGYAVKHNPWAYFVDERTACAHGDVPERGFLAAARADQLPTVGLLVPNKCHDAHDTDLGCSLATADTWLQQVLPTVLASRDFTSGRLAVVITADEDDTYRGSGTDNAVLTVVLQAGLDGKHLVVTRHLTHYSLSRLYSEVIGATPLRRAAAAPDMAAAFGLRVG